MGRFIQMGKELGYEGNALQELVKQQQNDERAERQVGYDKLKDALLKTSDMTERGFRKKFRYGRPERSETFIQFSSRLRSYLEKLA